MCFNFFSDFLKVLELFECLRGVLYMTRNNKIFWEIIKSMDQKQHVIIDKARQFRLPLFHSLPARTFPDYNNYRIH